MPSFLEKDSKRCFKIGDKVKYISGRFSDSKYNPLWGGICGKTVGRIIEVRNDSLFKYRVKWDEWDERITNGYIEGDLELTGISNPNNNIIIKM